MELKYEEQQMVTEELKEEEIRTGDGETGR